MSASPMARVPRPKVPVKPVPVLSDDQARRLVAYQAPKDRGRQTHEQARFNARRDAAMLRLARGTGPPRR